jgi:threonine/homoserine efflux transporter RhtA
MAKRIKMLLLAVLIGTAVILPHTQSVAHADPIGCPSGGCKY